MSDEDRDVDIESDEDDDDESGASGGYMTLAEKRAHHNALERKRRDHIKESFHSLRDSVPSLLGEKVKQASRAQILKQATDYITFMSKKNHSHQSDIEDIRKQNNVLEQQVRALERAKAAGTFAAAQSASLDAGSTSSKSSGGKNFKSESESSDSEPDAKTKRKKLKT